MEECNPQHIDLVENFEFLLRESRFEGLFAVPHSYLMGLQQRNFCKPLGARQ